MPRILAIDYGGKRTGIAVTDPLQIIASALTTVDTDKLMEFLEEYCRNEEVECIVIGEPFRSDGSHSDIEQKIQKFIQQLRQKITGIPIERMDESFSSQKAQQALIQSGMKKKKRREKKLLDSTAATIILQDYLQSRL